MKKLSLIVAAAALLAPAVVSAQDAATGTTSYPRCTATVTDQCTEGGGMGMHHKMMKHARHKHHMKAKAKAAAK
jgi:hypothetical protein